jgi:fructose/tagatose bisphosphate aldolase
MMADAANGGYAVGFFESWNLESLLAVADAAEAMKSPVILGFSGIYLPHPQRLVTDKLAPYAAMGRAVGEALSVPACLLFNESPHHAWVSAAIDAGFGLVMFSDEDLSHEALVTAIVQLVAEAHHRGAAIEAELAPLAGVGGDIGSVAPGDQRLTDPANARKFVEATRIDALAVNVGQMHLHGRRKVRLDLARLRQLSGLGLPLVLHGSTSVAEDDIRAAIEIGIRKINVGSRLKQAYLKALAAACAAAGDPANPYEAIGSGLEGDVLVAGRVAMQAEVERLMTLFGSAGRG